MSDEQKKFGTFEGVFTPAILTILGVIMYLRLGWVVGSVGLSASIVIILLAHVATVTTGLSLASLATNTRVGAGGFYAFVSRSLGPEVGGSIGIPLYISQTLSISLYIMGFSEAWTMLFPHHDPRFVFFITLFGLIFLSYIGAEFAMKIQYLIMALIVLSLISFYTAPAGFSETLNFAFELPKEDFWKVFAIFFPAVTGIGSGVSMSGDLKDPKKNLPFGILIAVAVGFVIYITLAIWYAGAGTPEELRSNSFLIVERSRWVYLVIPGILGATLSSALGSIIGAPRILQALASDHVIVLANVFAKVSKKGNPRSAILMTGSLVVASFFIGDLNSIATLLTMFFLISYAVINLTVLIEKAIRIPSFRPSFKISIVVPLVGVIWCTVVMFLINRYFAVAAYLVILTLYFSYVKRGLDAPFGDVRSGIFTAIAEWAVKTSMRLPQHEKTWKPNLIVPIKDPETWEMKADFIKAIVVPSGTLRLITVNETETTVDNKISGLISLLFDNKRENGISRSVDYKIHTEGYQSKTQSIGLISKEFKDEGIFVTSTVVDAVNFLEGLSIIIQTSRGMFFPPNIIFLTMSRDSANDRRLMEILAISIRENLGIILLKGSTEQVKRGKGIINIWLRVGSPNKNLAILTALQLEKNWSCRLRLLTSINSQHEREKAESELKEVVEMGRLNVRTEIHVIKDSFFNSLNAAPAADLNIFGINEQVSTDAIRKMSSSVQSACLFIMDSGNERMDV